MYNFIGNSFVFPKVGCIVELFYYLLYSVEECPNTQKPSPFYKRRRTTKKTSQTPTNANTAPPQTYPHNP